MGIILWIIFGALAGWVASVFMKTNAEQGMVLDIVVGIIGAVIGGWLMSIAGASGVTGFNFYSFAVAVLGACIFIAALRVFRRNT